ncbi:PAS domain-containing sensor histidine kinase [Dinghuibacter silviterrae]|uniref:PAS domain S-box-containing protein n=1 Tax=Dinghuibacter silviterrae TaxID=1539049 RepID=A0A4R8DX00_9BACT|nr:PAS domain-containing sensor histidine kinase [Dinghuibacter silviterrae]TDX01967.1 PAS domain S-box-containing protein [Dinghuibacter silviterrae]
MALARLLSGFFGRRSVQGLAFTEHRFRSLIENGMEVITLMDEHFMPIYRSPASIRLTGWTTEERRKTGMLAYIHPEDLPNVRKTLDETFNQPGRPLRISLRSLHKQGHYVWYEGTVTNLLQDKNIGAIVVNLHDVTEAKMAEERLRESHEELRQLASHLQDIREEERTAMAREIHDELGQQLTGLKMDVSWLLKRADLGDELLRSKLRGILSLLDATVGTVRRLAAELRPAILDDLGLPDALEWHSKQFTERFGIHCVVDITGEKAALPPGLATGLFRIFQEALTNVARHAKATAVSAELDMADDRIDLTITDNGKGFDVRNIIGGRKTLGLLGMKERALMMGGKCEWSSHPGKGTTIRVSVPLQPDLIETTL